MPVTLALDQFVQQIADSGLLSAADVRALIAALFVSPLPITAGAIGVPWWATSCRVV